jgi:hypothetical protein
VQKAVLCLYSLSIIIFSDIISNVPVLTNNITVKAMVIPEKLKSIHKKYYEDKIKYEEMTNEEALLILKYAESVDSEYTGFGGSVSLQRYAFKKLRKSEKLLEDLFLNSETNEGKVYALSGLAGINKELYEKYYNQTDLNLLIRTLSGCMVSETEIGKYLTTPDKLKKEKIWNEDEIGVLSISGFSE